MQTIPVLGGRYRLGPEIGSGGMGTVHRAWDERFEREVAIKVVHSGADSVERERLRREAQYLAGIDHPNLVAVLDAGADRLRGGDTVWFAMELVSGPDLRSVLRRDGALSGAMARTVLVGVLAAIEALHAAGVVHRDLKPANVLLTAEPSTGRWEVKLVDLGIAHLLRDEHLTSAGQVVGTAAYLSPEQVTGRPLGPPSDVYALGLLTIEALTNEIAFPGGPAETAAARLVRAPDLPRTLARPWRAVLAAMTALDPAARPSVAHLRAAAAALPAEAFDEGATEIMTATAPIQRGARSEAVTALLPVLPAAGRPAVAIAHPHRRRRRILASASVLLVLAAAGGGIAVLSGGHPPTAAAVTVSSPHPPGRSATPKPKAVKVTPSPTPSAVSPAPAATPLSAAPNAQPVPAARGVEGEAGKRLRRAERMLHGLLGHLGGGHQAP